MTSRFMIAIHLVALGPCFFLGFGGVANAQNSQTIQQRIKDGESAYVRGDYATALKDLTPLAQQGNAIAERDLGVLYGIGPQSLRAYSKAFYWDTLSAKQGLAGAEDDLGSDYEDGKGTAKDYRQADEWFWRSAIQGDAMGQINLASMYFLGRGVSQSYVKAYQWDMAGAEAGNPLAQIAVAAAYYLGHGVPQNYLLAYMWADLAGAQTSDPETIMLRDKAASWLSQDQLAQAQNLALLWRPNKNPPLPVGEIDQDLNP